VTRLSLSARWVIPLILMLALITMLALSRDAFAQSPALAMLCGGPT